MNPAEETATPGESEAPAIIAAAMAGDFDTVEHILSRKPGAVNEVDEDDSTALICSSVGGYLDIVQLLLDRAADPDRQDLIGGYSALILATKYNHLDIVRTLVQRGADTQKRDFEGNIAMKYAKTEEIKTILGRPDKVRKEYNREVALAQLDEAKKRAMLGDEVAAALPVTAPAPTGPKKTKSIFAK